MGMKEICQVYVGGMKESDQGVGRLHGPVVQVVLPHG